MVSVDCVQNVNNFTFITTNQGQKTAEKEEEATLPLLPRFIVARMKTPCIIGVKLAQLLSP